MTDRRNLLRTLALTPLLRTPSVLRHPRGDKLRLGVVGEQPGSGPKRRKRRAATSAR